jgi:hypothetical protein
MDGEDHYRFAMNLLAQVGDPDPEDAGKVPELVGIANAHMTAALIHALAPEQAHRWAMP